MRGDSCGHESQLFLQIGEEKLSRSYALQIGMLMNVLKMLCCDSGLSSGSGPRRVVDLIY